MIYRLVALFSHLSDIVHDAHALRARMTRRYGWMPE